jgi:hypothetical protein
MYLLLLLLLHLLLLYLLQLLLLSLLLLLLPPNVIVLSCVGKSCQQFQPVLVNLLQFSSHKNGRSEKWPFRSASDGQTAFLSEANKNVKNAFLKLFFGCTFCRERRKTMGHSTAG